MQGVAGTWPPRAGAQAGGFVPAGVPLWASFAERLRSWARAEAGAGRLLPWVPIAFGVGIALYFTAPREPVLFVAVVTAMACCAVAFLARRGRFFVAA
jgi:competence protein ComEC